MSVRGARETGGRTDGVFRHVALGEGEVVLARTPRIELHEGVLEAPDATEEVPARGSMSMAEL